MGRRSLKDKNIRKITRTGKGSRGITIPIEILRELGWRERQKVVVKKVRGGILIKDWPVSPKVRRGGKK